MTGLICFLKRYKLTVCDCFLNHTTGVLYESFYRFQLIPIAFNHSENDGVQKGKLIFVLSHFCGLYGVSLRISVVCFFSIIQINLLCLSFIGFNVDFLLCFLLNINIKFWAYSIYVFIWHLRLHCLLVALKAGFIGPLMRPYFIQLVQYANIRKFSISSSFDIPLS